MAAASKSPSTPDQAHNSRRPSAARGAHSPPYHSLSENVDREQSVTSAYFAPSDTTPHSKTVDAFSYLALDDSAAGSDDQLENSDNGGPAKKPAWNKPSNGAAAEIGGAVMGAESWPALSNSACVSPKSPLLLSNGSIITSEALSPRKEPDTSISTPNHAPPSGQRSMKRGGGGGPNHNRMAANGNLSQAPSMLGAFAESQQQNAGTSVGSAREYNKEDAHRVSGQRGRSFGGNELHSQHGPHRSNSGQQARADHHRHGARRDNHRRESFTSQKRDGSRPFVTSCKWTFCTSTSSSSSYATFCKSHGLPRDATCILCPRPTARFAQTHTYGFIFTNVVSSA